ncbi:cruciferin CRU1-like [Durio zibethinus]|uniref:Cruciferin CRU1-like n=1 Tax=Durio zibethinus TaxID=66656 RepID=A0A6P6A7T7_DURZI|nr:cruciferin CRU1-like [Durio zibethinus]
MAMVSHRAIKAIHFTTSQTFFSHHISSTNTIPVPLFNVTSQALNFHGCLSYLLSLNLWFHFLFHGCFAHECQIKHLQALEPKDRIISEAGYTESWDPDNEQLHCVGVAAHRYTVRSKGLALPSFDNVPKLFYVVQGSEPFWGRFSQVVLINKKLNHSPNINNKGAGDIYAMPAGTIAWTQNDGESEFVAVSIADQSKQKFKSFPSSLDEEVLAASVGIDHKLAKKLQIENDCRGNIVRVIRPPELKMELWQFEEEEEDGEEQERELVKQGKPHVSEESCLSMKLKHQTDPSFAEAIHYRGGI